MHVAYVFSPQRHSIIESHNERVLSQIFHFEKNATKEIFSIKIKIYDRICVSRDISHQKQKCAASQVFVAHPFISVIFFRVIVKTKTHHG